MGSELVLVHGAATHWQVRCGDTVLAVDRHRGGVARLTRADSRVDLGLHLVLGDGSKLSQAQDPDARIIPLQQSVGSAGLRSQFGFFARGVHVGEGFTEYWLAEDGRLFVSTGVRILDEIVHRAALSVVALGAWTAKREGTEVRLGAPGGRAVGVEWSSTVHRQASAIEWVRTRPPFYRRWLSYLDQWSLDPATEGFDRDDTGGGTVLAGDEEVAIELAWRDRGAAGASAPRPGAGAGFTARGAVLVAVGSDEEVRRALVARRRPLDLQTLGDDPPFHETVDGTIAVAATGPKTVVTVPADPLARWVRLRIDGLEGRGGIRVSADTPAGTTIVSARDGVDDPLVGLVPSFRGRADTAVVSLRSRPDAPVHVEACETDGLHAAVQRLDPDRRITVHHPADPDDPILEISTTRLRITGLRLPGRQIALYDLPLHWLRYLAKSAAHVADQPRSVHVEDWGPENVIVRLDGANADGSVDSSYRLTIPYLRDRVEVLVEATLRGASRWAVDSAEYADVFPEAGIDPTRWRYESVVLLRSAGDHVLSVADPYPGLDTVLSPPVHALEAFGARVADGRFGPWPMAPGDAVLLHGAAAGDVGIVLDGASPRDLRHVATYCEHWADVHLDVVRGAEFPSPSELPPGAPGRLPDDIVARYRLVLSEPTADLAAGMDALRSFARPVG